MTVVLDASAVLAAIFAEPGADRVAACLDEGAILGAVNLAEVVGKLVDAGFRDDDLRAMLDELSVAMPAFDEGMGIDAGRLRGPTRSLGLSLGDRCCLSLAIARKARVVTADRAWAGLDLGVEVEVIR